jgi:hypothetical protein
MQLVLFNLVGVSDLKREEGKGSFYIIISFLAKSTSPSPRSPAHRTPPAPQLRHRRLAQIRTPRQYFKYACPQLVVVQYLFLVMVEDALKDPQSLKYLFIEPFQVKAKFYPLFFFALLMLGSIRVDLLVPIILGAVFHLTSCNSLITRISTFLDDRFLSEQLVSVGFLKTGSEHR